MYIPAPRSEAELLSRARQLAGRTLGQLAQELGQGIPRDLRWAKGWIGEAIETALGGTAASLPEPDFQALGVELKTIPIGRDGRPRESTYVCVVPLTDNIGLRWEASLVRRKLARVLWVPVEAAPDLPPAQRKIGAPLLWSPSLEEEEILREDFEELMDMVCLGRLDEISARYGTWLQIRPKAANSRALIEGIGPSGTTILTLPRGFYLRAVFTTEMLHRHYVLP